MADREEAPRHRPVVGPAFFFFFDKYKYPNSVRLSFNQPQFQSLSALLHVVLSSPNPEPSVLIRLSGRKRTKRYKTSNIHIYLYIFFIQLLLLYAL